MPRVSASALDTEGRSTLDVRNDTNELSWPEKHWTNFSKGRSILEEMEEAALMRIYTIRYQTANGLIQEESKARVK